MITSELISLYSDYYRNAESWPKLLNGLKEYEFDDLIRLQEEVINMTPNIVDDSIQQSNSGLKYHFAPIFIKPDLENYLRYTHDVDEYHFICESKVREESVVVDAGKIRYTLKIPDIWSNWKDVAQFINRTSSKTYVFGYANSLNQMTSNPNFLESVDIIGFVNSHGPAFLKSTLIHDLEFNDQMINWKSGANFRTCQYGNKHCLPIFAVRNGMGCNLLNLNRPWFPLDDLFQLKNICACGKPCVDFLPHIFNQPDFDYDKLMSLPNQLTSKFLWLQIIQQRSVKIMYQTSIDTDISTEDMKIIKELGEVTFDKGSCLQIGSKLPPFWKISKIL